MNTVSEPASDAKFSNRFWIVVCFIAAIVAAAFLPDRTESRITPFHLGAVTVTVIASWFLIVTDACRRDGTTASRLLRWHSLPALTLVAFVIGIRICFPAETWAGGDNYTLQRSMRSVVAIPLVLLCLTSVLFPAWSATARESPSFWLVTLLTLAVTTSVVT